MKKYLQCVGTIAAVIFGLTVGVAMAAPAPNLDVEPANVEVGATVKITGEGFDAGAKLDLVWRTSKGSWKLSTNEEGQYTGSFLGPQFEPASEVLASVKADGKGRFEISLTVPEDFGGIHDLAVVSDGKEITKAGLRITPSVEYSPKEGPVGTPLTITVKGLNHPHYIEGWYMLLYDNKLAGYLTGMKSRGTATVTIPATGGLGMHVVEIQNAPFGHPYRALETSPYQHLPVFKLRFRITPGAPVLPPDPKEQITPPRPGIEPPGNSPAIWFNPSGAMVGTPSVLHGKGFPAGAEVEVYKYGQRGNRVTAGGFWEVKEPFAKVKADQNGRINYKFDYPDTHGGTHKIGAAVAGQELAFTFLEVYRTPVYFQPKGQPVSGPTFEVTAGTELELKVKGIGWSETENIFAIVYDNAYIGYSCGFSSVGDVLTYLMATGEPGWHYIDLYPSFYRNNKYAEAVESPFMYRSAVLNWQDHPNPFRLRYAFYITEEK